MRLIDADVLKELILKERDAIPMTVTERYTLGVEYPNKHGNSMRGGIRKALRCLEQTPTVDAVKVVRCEDCKYSGMYAFGCGDTEELACLEIEEDGFIRFASAVEPNGFCSKGERKNAF